jgi:hypothetical protein
MSTASAQAVLIQPLFSSFNAPIVQLATKYRLAVMSSYRDTTRAGGLISYSADHAAYFQRAAIFVDKISQGRQTRRSACGTTDEIRTRRQPQGGEGSGLRHLSELLAQRRRGDRIGAWTAAVGKSLALTTQAMGVLRFPQLWMHSCVVVTLAQPFFRCPWGGRV